jgi:hypothetical protein
MLESINHASKLKHFFHGRNGNAQEDPTEVFSFIAHELSKIDVNAEVTFLNCFDVGTMENGNFENFAH